MKRTIFLLAVAAGGCSTAPVADVMDFVAPGNSAPRAEVLPPETAAPPLPTRLPVGAPTAGTDAPPLPPPPVE